MKEDSRQFLRQLLSVHGPSGFESGVQKVWLEQVSAFADETGTDAYGNAFAILNPKASPRILVVGHADEIGYQVRHITEKGFLYVARIGGSDFALARGQRVLVHGEKGAVKGVFGSLAIHLQDKSGDSKAPKEHELFVDIGAVSRADAEKRVAVGDPITMAVGCEELSNDVWTSRAVDNRGGIFAAAEALRLCSQLKKLDACVIAVSTIQEENGLYGAQMVGNSLGADAALVVDVGHSTDIPLCDPKKDGEAALGKGPLLSRGSVNHPLLVGGLRATAKKEKIPVQIAIDPRWSGTDADAIFREKGGIPSAVISLPLRYMHSPVETFHLKDLENLSRLLAAFCGSVKKNERFHLPRK